MNTTYPFPFKLFPIKDNFISLHSFLKTVYTEKKDSHVQRISLLKGLFEVNDKVTYCANIFTSTVNNFLKDLSQIEDEFRNEHLKAGGYCICMQGKVLSDEEVLSLQMEENY